MNVIIKKSVIFVGILAFCGFETYAALHVKPITKNILSLLDDTLEVDVKANKLVSYNLPADVSFLFSDIKFTGEQIKICEFGGIMAGVHDTQVMINNKEETVITPYWSLFWHFVKQYNTPIWYIGDKMPAITKELLAVGGQYFDSLKSFTQFIDSSDHAQKARNSCKNIKNCAGILVLGNNAPVRVRQNFIKNYPGIVLVNSNVRRFTVKELSYKLFHEDPELAAFMPRLKSYEKKYTRDLARQICNDIPTDYFVIKPINAMQSKGVRMTDAAGLDAALKLILRDTSTIPSTEHRSLSYWKNDKNKTFFVEEYAPSKTITIEGKPYDPTMRLVFFMSHEDGIMKINVIAGYWKIPVKSLTDEAPLTERHITKPFSGDFFTGRVISSEDMKKAKNILKVMLSKIYPKMLVA